MKKQHIAYVAIPTLAFSLLAVGVSSAHMRAWDKENKPTQEEREQHRAEIMEKKAELIGISVEELQAAKEEGKRFHELAEEKGIDFEELKEKMHAERMEHMKERIAEAVVAGEITQEEADEKLTKIEEHHKNGKHFLKKRMKNKWQKKGERVDQ